MKRISSEPIGSLTRGSYYFKRLILYSAFVAIAVVVSSLLVFSYSNKILEKETTESNSRLLAQVKIFSDRYLIDKIYTLISEKFLGFSQDRLFADFFSYSGSSDPNTFLRIHKNISNTVLNNDLIDSIYLYRTSDDVLISSREGVDYDISDARNADVGIVNMALIREVMNSGRNRSWICPSEEMTPTGNGHAISLVQLIPLYAKPAKKTGCVIFSIDTDAFLGSLGRVYDMTDGHILIVDSRGRLFAQNDSSDFFEQIKYTGILETILSQNSGFQISSFDEKKMGISWLKSHLTDWYYVSVVPVEVLIRRSLVVRQFAVIAVGLIVFLSLVGVNIMTTRLCKPLRDIVHSAREKLHIKQGTGNELSFINNVISDISNRTAEMKEILEKNRELIQYKAVIDILDGNIDKREEIEDRLRLAGQHFSYDSYGVILTEINATTLSSSPVDRRVYITYRTTEIADRHLSETCNCISVNHPSNCIVTVINFKDHGAVLRSLPGLLRLLENELGILCNIAASRATRDLLLSSVYNATKSFLEYSFVYGYGNVFGYGSIEEYQSNDREFNSDDLREIESLLRSCNTQLLKETITEVVESLRDNRCSCSFVRNVLLQIIETTARVCRKQGIAEPRLDRDQMMSEYRDISSLDETVDWFRNLIDVCHSNIIVRNTHMDYEFISRIVEYVSANIDKQISLDIVADEFDISSSHLSRVFKRCSGTSFSDFVRSKKLEKAAELIVKERNVNVSDIEVRLGYLTPAYFSKLFKEEYGMTPAQFRKQSVIDNSPHS